MKRKRELAFDIFLAVLGSGLIVANIIHYVQYDKIASTPAVIGGVIILLVSIIQFLKIKSKSTPNNIQDAEGDDKE